VDASRLAQASADDLAAARLGPGIGGPDLFLAACRRGADAYLQESLEAYEQSLKLTQNRYQAGVVSSADVAQAQSQYKSTQASLLEARITRAQYEHALAALLGKRRPISACR
jgi:multidrug resistance efflux pump